MSSDELRSIFHVEDVDQVPHYELVQLIHHGPESTRSKRAIRTNSFGGGAQQQLFNAMDKVEPNHEGVHHVKKDLSKNAYASATKQRPSSDSASANKISVNKMPISGGVPPSESDNLRDDVEVNVDGETGRLDDALPQSHNVSLTAFGEQLHLKLTPTEGLFKNGGPHTLRMWTVKPNPNASQGLDYEEVIEVSYSENFSNATVKLDPIPGPTMHFSLPGQIMIDGRAAARPQTVRRRSNSDTDGHETLLWRRRLLASCRIKGHSLVNANHPRIIRRGQEEEEASSRQAKIEIFS